MSVILGSWYRRMVTLPPGSLNYPWKYPKLLQKRYQMYVLGLKNVKEYDPENLQVQLTWGFLLVECTLSRQPTTLHLVMENLEGHSTTD